MRPFIAPFRRLSAVAMICLAAGVALSALAGCRRAAGPVSCKQHAFATEGGILYQVDYGYTGEQVVFVLFQKGRGKAVVTSSITTTTSPSGERTVRGWFDIPGKGRVEVSRMCGGYEADDSGVRDHKITFTASELGDFVNSYPAEYSFRAIEQFLKAQPVKTAK